MSWTLANLSMRLKWPGGSPVLQDAVWALKSLVDICSSNDEQFFDSNVQRTLRARLLSPSMPTTMYSS